MTSMKDKTKIVKDVMQKGVADKATFGTNPSDPWSAKSNIAETALLNQFLKSRGVNPKFVTKNQKVGFSKTGAFDRWLQNHMSGGRLQIPKSADTGPHLEDVVPSGHATDFHGGNSHVPSPAASAQARINSRTSRHNIIKSIKTGGLRKEEVDKKDVVSMDIPLLIRMLELAREDIKSDMDLHKVVEKLINIRKKGVLTMDDYEYVSSIKESLAIFEDKFQDTYAATQAVGTEVEDPDKGPENPRLSAKKSAKMVKELYKKIREDMYAWDAEDKDTKQPLGKKAKLLQQPDIKNMGDNKAQAAAVLTGGTTMTGQPRDDVEFDPMLKVRPNQPGQPTQTQSNTKR